MLSNPYLLRRLRAVLPGACPESVSLGRLPAGGIHNGPHTSVEGKGREGDPSSTEPFKTLFAVAWFTGMRAGELLALTLDDLDFEHQTIRVNKSADDRTREIRQPKTKCSVALLPMPSALEARLRDYLRRWKPNPAGILFATRDGSRPRSRANVVRVGLKPVLRLASPL